MNKIKFSHRYNKLFYSETFTGFSKMAMLIEVLTVNLENLSRQFISYDTDGLYQLPKKGEYLMLIFTKDEGANIFTTLRRKTEVKEKYYRSKIGEYFKLEIVGAK